MEVSILVGVYFIYAVSRGSLTEKAAVAFDNAREIIDLEKSVGLFIEPDIQSFFLESSLRMDIANSLYTYCYYPPLILFAIWAYWRHRNKYKIVRTVFVFSSFLAFICFALYPLAPPRFFDGNHGVENLGFVDTLVTHWNINDKSISAFYNPYAAMPSLHQGWTLMIGTAVIWMTRSWVGKALGAALPIAMFIGIISTGNHFVLDAIGGALVLAIAASLTILLMKFTRSYHPRENEVEVPATEGPKEAN
ncbi:MAG: phosphatase PAP2 family protein [Dehalococcoidia bacterium]